jgi:hypothetical protein
VQGAETKVRAKSAAMTTDGERFEEIFWKHAAIPDSEPVETVTDAVAAKHLKLPAKHPLLKTTECYFDQRNRPCGVFITCYHPALVQLRIRYAG